MGYIDVVTPGDDVFVRCSLSLWVSVASAAATQFVLVAAYLAIEFVGQGIDGRVHVLAGGVGVQGGALRDQGGLGLVLTVFDLQDDAGTDGTVEMSFDARKFLRGVFPKRRGYIHLLTADGDLHGGSSVLV